MGCSSSREALGSAVAPAERRQGLRSRSLAALSSLGMCRRRNDGVRAYVTRPLAEAAAKGSAGGPAGAEDAASVTSSWTAPRKSKPPAPFPPPVHTAPDLDSVILPGLRQIVEDYPPSHPGLLYPECDCPVVPLETTVAETCDVVDMGTPVARDIPEVVTGIVRALVDEFHEQMEKKKNKKAADDAPDVEDDDNLATPRRLPALIDVVNVTTPRSLQPAFDVVKVTTPKKIRPARAGKSVVIYFTSLRGVRRTFEDGRAVRAILRCYRVRVDDRDVSMHAAFKSELRALVSSTASTDPALPRVFLDDGRLDLGGAEDVRALHEAGELAGVLAGCEASCRLGAAACAACGDARFALCETCHGSCKLFVGDYGGRRRRRAGCFQRCPDCNENGLIRCPVCCY